MTQYGSYGSRGRAEQRKKKRNNFLINGAIGLVLVGIVFVSGMLIFGGNSSEPAATNNENENNMMNVDNETNENNGQENNGMNEEDIGIDNEENRAGNNESNINDNGSNNHENNENETNEENEENEENAEEVYNTTPTSPEDWEPIGTVQEEPFAAVYDREHINWEEMKRALQYATGLGDDMTIWWLGNGGDHQSAEAFVGKSELRDTPYKVRLEWVANEGWMPVSLEIQSENPY